MAPCSIALALPFPGRRDVFVVEYFRDSFEGGSIRSHLENASDDRSLGVVDLQSSLVIIRSYIVVTEASSPGVFTFKGFSFESTMRLLSQFFDVQGIN